MIMLAGLNIVLVMGLAILLIQRFRSTGNSGYLVLAVPLVLWPFIRLPLRWLLQSQIDRKVEGKTVLWPLSLFGDSTVGETVAGATYVMAIVETALVIVGFLWLARGHVEREPHPPATANPGAAGSR